jgi:hypothetical protein
MVGVPGSQEDAVEVTQVAKKITPRKKKISSKIKKIV